MIKFENTQTYGWEAATRGARAPLQSWGKSDTRRVYDDELTTYGDNANVKMYHYEIGPNDHELLLKLAKAGPEHGKYLRMIGVTVDITMPTYFMAELSTYKVGTTMNSTSLQHTGSKRDFTIRDFSVDDERVYEILDPPVRDHRAENPLIYPYETDEYKDYVTSSGRKYKVYRNGRVFAYPFEYVDTWGTGRKRHIDEFEVSPYQTKQGGYWCVRIGGRKCEHLMLHRLVASVWLGDRSGEGLEINHKNKKRGDCSVENLEWVTHVDNERHKHETYKIPLHVKYKNHCESAKYSTSEKAEMRKELEHMTYSEVAAKHGCSIYTVQSAKLGYSYSLGEDIGTLFELCDAWNEIIKSINYFRNKYVETNDYAYFRAMRQLMPMGYNYTVTWSANYAVLRNIYGQRKNHRLSEWSGPNGFCHWIEGLPYSELLTEV